MIESKLLVGNLRGFGIVRDHQQRHVELFIQTFQQIEYLIRCVCVQVASRLVRNHNLRVGNDCTRNTNPLFLTTREVADLLRVKERKVYDLAAADEIPHRRITGKLLFPRAELLA